MIGWLVEKIKRTMISLYDTADGRKLRSYYKRRYNISIGKYTYGYHIEDIGTGSRIGAFCSIASGTKIGLMNHPTNFVSTNPFLYYKSRGFIQKDKEIKINVGAIIEDDVWIGTNAVILPGIKVGKGSIIAAGAVVTKDIAPFDIVGGIPAKHIKWRFEDPKIREALLMIDYAAWDDEMIKRNIEHFYDVNEFINAFGKGMT